GGYCIVRSMRPQRASGLLYYCYGALPTLRSFPTRRSSDLRMRERLGDAAGRLSGPGWAWLVRRRDGRLAILATPHSATPLAGSDTPLLACCLWPHALPGTGGDALQRYLAAYWALLDWSVVEARLEQARAAA